jgi:hypothetical protein
MAALSMRPWTACALFLISFLVTGCGLTSGLLEGRAGKPNATIQSPLESTAGPESNGGFPKTLANELPPPSEEATFLPDLAAPQFGAAAPIEAPPTLDSPEWKTVPSAAQIEPPVNKPQTVWGILDFRGFPVGDQMASNGIEYHQLFLLDLSFNIMLWREKRIYLFADSSFWGQKAAPGITNPTQGQFDFSKREFDFDLGAAWNYAGSWEGRVFAYSFNSLNRGNSLVSPAGFNDGIGLENRYYLGETYAHLGDSAFDQARATFVSVGYYPSKTMEDGNGNQFKPGAFLRSYLTYDLWGPQYYAYADLQFLTSRSFTPTLLNWDAGLAARPFHSISRLEFRIGSLGMLTLHGDDVETSLYLSIRYVF